MSDHSEPRALMLAAYMAFIRGVDIPETIEQARAVLVERALTAEAQVEQLAGDVKAIQHDYSDAKLAVGTLQTALRQFVDQLHRVAAAERADEWCNTADRPIWRSIHDTRAEVYEKIANQLSALLPALELTPLTEPPVVLSALDVEVPVLFVQHADGTFHELESVNLRAWRERSGKLTRYNCDCLNAGPDGTPSDSEDAVYCERWVYLVHDVTPLLPTLEPTP